VSNSILELLERINEGKLVFPVDVISKEAFLMEKLQRKVKYYLLKRYVRRSNRKPKDQLQKEVYRATPGQKVNKYKGNRFDVTESIDDFATNGAMTIEDPYMLEIEKLIKILSGTELTNRDLKILGYRLEDYTYEEISELIGTTKSGTPATKESIRKEHTRAMKHADIDISAFKIEKREAINPNKKQNIQKIEFV
jgi:hypothetical protein